MSELEEKVISRLHNLNTENQLSNECLVQIIEVCSLYLNLCIISKYAKNNNMSYNGVKNHREVKNILGVKFVIDND